MRTIILLLLILPVCWNLNAQDLVVSRGDTLNNMVEQSVQYAFEDFSDGKVFFKDGTSTRAKLNYNYLVREMLFIDPASNQVQALSGISEIATVSIGNRRFIPAGSELEFLEILTKGSTYLAVERRADVISKGKTGAYGTTSTTASVQSLSRIYGDGANIGYTLDPKDNVNVRVENRYYLYANGKKTFVKGVKTFTKAYPNGASLIEKYVDDNMISFKKEDDLIKLTEYCDQL